MTSGFSPDRLNAALGQLGIQHQAALFDKLRNAYREPGRHYHTEKHVDACLSHLDEVRPLALHPAEIEIALWFHDAVYDTHRNDNEEQSAAWARDYLSSQGVDGQSIDRIVNMIIATKMHQAASGDTALMLDIDLSILGAAAPVFESYDRSIRREYAWVPEDNYRRGRAAVLGAFLAKPHIYCTASFRQRFEAVARGNLERKIAELEESLQ